MYFRNFPTISYTKQNGEKEIIQDIITRIGFIESVKTEAETFIIYNVPDGYSPENIAEDVYGDQQLFWVVLLFNDFLDPLYSIPLRSRSLDNYTERKYRSKTLFITQENNLNSFFFDTNSFKEGDTITLYRAGNLATRYKDSGVDKVLGVVKRFIPELSAIELDSLVGNINRGDIIVRGYDNEVRATVAKVVDSIYAPHHFESAGSKLNPLATPPDDNGYQVPIGQTGDGFGIPVTPALTVLDNYINQNDTQYVFTNQDYEFKKNETNRSIKLLSPELLDNVLREFNEVLET